MTRSSALCALVSASVIAGCGGAPAEVREPEKVTEKLAELRAQRRRDRIRMREMEERMANLASERPDLERPELPVERLVPVEPEGEIEVVGVASDGTEIVYADEAANDASVAAPTDLLRADKPAPPRRAKRRRPEPPPPELPGGARGDSLGTTTRVPAIKDVLRSSRRPAAQARKTRPRRRRPPVATTPATAVAEYQRLVRLVRSGDHEPAIAGLRRFVDRYPRSDYADNAQYWLAEAYYDDRRFEEALGEFQRVLERFPDGNKVSDALLKAAFCKLNLDRRSAAIELLERVIAEHPDSRPAGLARQKLQRLRQ